MRDANRLLPRAWIIAAVVVGIVAAVAAFGLLVATEPDPPSPELVAEVQGVPPPDEGSTPCWDLRFAEFAAANAQLTQSFRAESIDAAGESFEDAAEVATDAVQVEAFDLFGQAFSSDVLEDLSVSAFDLDAVVAQEVEQQATEIDPADAFTAVIDLC